MSSDFRDCDIAVVGMGCVFPEAPDTAAYWENLKQGRCSLRELPESRWESRCYLSEEPGEPDRAYSRIAGYVEEEILEALRGRFPGESRTRLQLMALEATRQSLEGLSESLYRDKRSFIALGCMAQDEQAALHQFLQERDELQAYVKTLEGADRRRASALLKRTFEDLERRRGSPVEATLTTSVGKALFETFPLRGEFCVVDAACASSLAALDAAVIQLAEGEADFALAGGVESQLGPEYFVMFCRLGLHAPERTLPLDDRTAGMNQGEGAGVVALMRLGDAVSAGVPVIAVIRGCGGSSNGRAASLFSPTVEGQGLALEGAHGSPPAPLDYIECHATGTRVGDTAELAALDRFLGKRGAPVPVGSVKALIGHTKGAAGAAGLIKCLLALRHRTVPPSPYFESFIGGIRPSRLFVNREPLSLAEKKGRLRMGVSSAGFGGTNYHVVVEQFEPKGALIREPKPAAESVVVAAHAHVPRKGIREYFAEYGFPIPPRALAQIDDLQLVALVAVAEALDRLALKPEDLPRTRTSVLSASILGLDAYNDMARRLRHFEMERFATEADRPLLALLEGRREKFPEITEDSGPGVLNNVLAGRVANVFDFWGRNFNVDADRVSVPCALRLAQGELRRGTSDWIVLLASEEEFVEQPAGVARAGMWCALLTRETQLRALGREPVGTLEPVGFAP